MTVTPRDEQEVIITYDREADEWHYFGDVPKLNRKWRPLITPIREEVEKNGNISLLEGKIIGNVLISKKRVLSEEQRKASAERFKAYRMQSKG